MEINKDMKKCTKCKKLLPISEFYKNKTKKNGLHGICKECFKEYDLKPIIIDLSDIKESKRIILNELYNSEIKIKRIISSYKNKKNYIKKLKIKLQEIEAIEKKEQIMETANLQNIEFEIIKEEPNPIKEAERAILKILNENKDKFILIKDKGTSSIQLQEILKNLEELGFIEKKFFTNYGTYGYRYKYANYKEEYIINNSTENKFSRK